MNGRRLATVLRIREIQERVARGEVAGRRLQHRAAAEREARTWTQLDGRADRAISDRNLIISGMLAARTQHEATSIADRAVDAALASWSVAARRVEGLQRLGERVAAGEATEIGRRTSNEIDDMVLARFVGGR